MSEIPIARTKRDEILFHILKGQMEGLPHVNCGKFVYINGQALHHLLNWDYIQHHGNSNYSLTGFGLKSLQARYAQYFRSVELPESIGERMHLQ